MDIPRALAFSRFASQAALVHPSLLAEIETGLAAPFQWEQAQAAIDNAADAETLARVLRETRRRVFLHAMLRDLTARAPLTEICGAMSTLADTALTSALRLHAATLEAVHGVPRCEDTGETQTLIVLGMGKLGGHELNVSSDIDLVFVYPDEGETAGPRAISNREFFDRLGRGVIATLNDVNGDGFVFRVDMRLRPYGDSGPLTTSFAGLENYLVTQGRAWERYAWLKARAITGNHHDELAALVTPFVYRKYLDYDAYEGLRDIHRQIREQGARRDFATNVKLGEGGIREIEFVVQALQIVRGGREHGLRVRGTLPALAKLDARGLLPGSAARELADAYDYLRRVEHRLQYRDDQQTHDLPTEPSEREQLAEAMDAPSLTEFDRQLAHHRRVVARTFAQILGDGGNTSASSKDAHYIQLWDAPELDEMADTRLREAGFDDPAALVTMLARTRASSRYLQLPGQSRQRFDKLMPQLMAVAAEHPGLAGAQQVFSRVLGLLEAISRRSAYLALVIEHPPLLPRLAGLMSASAWAADYLTRHPILLDELLDARALFADPDWTVLARELAEQLAAHPDDAEYQMDSLRHFQHAQKFRLLAQDLAGQLTVERLADHLSALADVVLEATLAACWAHLAGADAPAPHFAIIGYGKLGGKELGYASDLDLVFLFDIEEGDPDPDSKEERYTRLGQRLNTWLSTTTSAGQLYETDLRLRPDGAKGLLVSSLRSFRKYQRENAWTWERQALTRARFVAGYTEIGVAFEAEREAILRRPGDLAVLAREVVAMRQRMFAGHPNATPLFDVKHDPGGMVDIEFTIQYLVLAYAQQHPSLTRNAGNIALLGMAGELGLVPAPLAAQVADSYRLYRRAQHKQRLTGAREARVDPTPYAASREGVSALWALVFGAAWQDVAHDEPPVTGRSRLEIG